MKTEGLLSYLTSEEVSSNLDRRSENGRLESKPGERRERRPGRHSDAGGNLHGRRRKLAGGLSYGPTGHGMHIRGHREEAGERGVKAGPRRWPEGAAVATVTMDGGEEHTGASGQGARS